MEDTAEETKEQEYSEYSYSEYSEEEDEDDKRRREMIRRAQKANQQSENKLLSNFIESSRKFINEIGNTVGFDMNEGQRSRVCFVDVEVLSFRR